VNQDRTSAKQRGAIGVSFALIVALSAFLAVGLASAGEGCSANTGENGATWLDGTTGDDPCIAGGNGPDVLKGKGGDDFLVGGRGPDTIRGGRGDDVLRGGQGPDTFNCGPGNDTVFNHRSTAADTIDGSCERVA